jgi:hypothetical protein
VSTTSDHDLEFLRAVGEFTVRFAELESQLRTIIVALAGTPEAVGEVLTDTLSFTQLANVYFGLCVTRASHTQAPVRALRERLHHLNARRNAMMYFAWAPDSGPPVVPRDWRTTQASDTLHWPARDAPLPAVLHAITETVQAFDDLLLVAKPALDACALQQPAK